MTTTIDRQIDSRRQQAIDRLEKRAALWPHLQAEMDRMQS